MPRIAGTNVDYGGGSRSKALGRYLRLKTSKKHPTSEDEPFEGTRKGAQGEKIKPMPAKPSADMEQIQERLTTEESEGIYRRPSKNPRRGR